MSKVLVDRVELEEAAKWLEVHSSSSGSAEAFAAEALREAIAQPAEAEVAERWSELKRRAEYCLQMREGEWPAEESAELASIRSFSAEAFIAATTPTVVLELIAALSAVTAERDSLLQFKAAHLEWHEKTEWVQETAQVHELGKHRADVLKDRIDQLRAEVEMMREDAERWRYVSLQGDDTHWLNLLRVDLEDFGGNINAAVDALIDGDTPVTAAKEA